MLRLFPAPINGVRPAFPVPLGCCGQFARATQGLSLGTAIPSPPRQAETASSTATEERAKPPRAA